MITHFKQNKTLTLLVSLLLLILIFPFFETSRVGSVFFILLYTSVLLTGVYAISYDVRYISIGILLAAPILICQWSNLILDSFEIDVLGKICTTFFMAYTLIALLERVFKARRVGFNEIYGAICAYILIGMVFAYVYLLTESWAPGSFRFDHDQSPADTAPFLYYSFSALAGGGSDVYAAAPFARSLTLLEVLIGVVYVAVLIGRLINALNLEAPDQPEAAERRNKEKILQDMLRDENPFKKRPVGLVMAAVMFNFVASIVMIHLKLPFFLDSWGTSFAVILGGWQAGIAVAVLYNLLIAATYWGWSAWIWMFSSLLVASMTWFFFRLGWVSVYKPFRLSFAGIVTGILNSALVQFIIFASNLPPYQATLPVYQFFLKLSSNSTFAAVAEKVFVEVADKMLSLLIAAVVVFLFHDLLQKYKKRAGSAL